MQTIREQLDKVATAVEAVEQANRKAMRAAAYIVGAYTGNNGTLAQSAIASVAAAGTVGVAALKAIAAVRTTFEILESARCDKRGTGANFMRAQQAARRGMQPCWRCGRAMYERGTGTAMVCNECCGKKD